MADSTHDLASPTDGPSERRMVRSPTSLFRLLIGVSLLLLGVLAAWRFDNTITAFYLDLNLIISVVPSWLTLIPAAVVTAILLITPVVVNVKLARQRRWRLLLVVDLAAIAAIAVSGFLVGISTTTPPSQFPEAYIPLNDLAAAGGPVTPNDIGLAAFTAALIVGLPYLNRPTRRLGAAVVVLRIAMEFCTNGIPPVGWLVDLGAGITCGALAALVFGTPDIEPRAAEIAATLARSGFQLLDAHPAAVDARGSTPWFATTIDDRRLFVKVLNQDNRSADLMFRMFRLLTFRSSGDERPFPSLRRAVEHEALMSMRAGSAGVRTPRLEAVSTIGTDSMLLAFVAIRGDSLDRVGDDDMTDEVLAGVWSQLEVMRANGIAHRDLRLANVFLADDDDAWIIDFGFAELAASDLLLNTDVAELLGSTATKVGVERAVDAAERAIGTDALAEALPRIQPFALGSATRTQLRDNELFEPLRAAVRERTGVEDVEYEPLAPIRGTRLVAAVAVAAVFWVALGLVTGELDSLVDAFTPEWRPLLVALVASAATYVGATLAQIGAFRDALQFLPTLESRLASSFANRVTPARSGGVALNVRFLQKQGVETGAALQSVGLTAVAGLVVHVLFLIVTTRIGVLDHDLETELNPSVVTALVFGTAAIVGGVLILIPAWRSRVMRTLMPAVTRAGSGLRDIAGRPLRLFQLLIGSIVVTGAYMCALVFSTWAVGGTDDFLPIAVVFLVATIAAAPAPTPGGLGIVELALVAGLIIFGTPVAVALPAVFLYRLITFWLPVPAGLGAYRALVRSGRL